MITIEEKINKLDKKVNVLVDFISDYVEMADRREEKYRSIVDRIVKVLEDMKGV